MEQSVQSSVSCDVILDRKDKVFCNLEVDVRLSKKAFFCLIFDYDTPGW